MIRNRWLKRAPRRAFTLVEIMLVVIILMVLAGLVVPNIVGRGKQARINATKISMTGVKNALQEFEMNASRFPTGQEGLEALVEKPSGMDEMEWAGPYLEKVPKDAFGEEFKYIYPPQNGTYYDLISAGPDRQFDTEDDITNWDDDDEDNL